MNKRIVFHITDQGYIAGLRVYRAEGRRTEYVNVRPSFNPAFEKILAVIMANPVLSAKVRVVPTVEYFNILRG